MSGQVGDLSPQQESALEKLKQNTSDVTMPYFDDYFYLRWLRAREFDVSKAEAMLRKHLKFRKRFDVDNILTNYKPHPVIDKYFPQGFLGPDKEGYPVRFINLRNLDMKGMAYSAQKSDVSKYITHMFEDDIKLMKELSEKYGKVIEKHSYIVDVEGYTFRQGTSKEALNLVNSLLRLYEINYPERMKTTYFINIPTYFSLMLNLSRPFIAAETFKKFRFFKKDFAKHLLEDIDAEVLPKLFGGTRTDPDGNPRCETMINYGGIIPEECYVVKNTVQSLEKQEGVKEIKVPKKSFRTIEFKILEPNSTVEWMFETTASDIAVGLYFLKEDGHEPEEIISPERVSCHLVPESGTFYCEKTGTYLLKFDNSFSWFSSKRVFYQIKILPPSAVNLEDNEEDFH